MANDLDESGELMFQGYLNYVDGTTIYSTRVKYTIGRVIAA